MWETAFGRSPIIQWIKDQIDLLSGGEPADLASKVGVPDEFTAGNFASYNPSTGKLEQSIYNQNSFVATQAGKGLSTNDFTTPLKTKLEELPEADDLEVTNKMDKVTQTAGNLGDLLQVTTGGNSVPSGVKAAGVYQNFAVSFGGIIYPTTYNLDTIQVTEGLRTVWAFYVLGAAASRTNARAGQFLIFLDGPANQPHTVAMGSGVKGTDFDGLIGVSVVNQQLRFSYTQTEGANNASYLQIKLITL